jgi:hypothetical protein
LERGRRWREMEYKIWGGGGGTKKCENFRKKVFLKKIQIIKLKLKQSEMK